MVDVGYPVPKHLDDPRFRRVFEYWRARFDGDRLPGRTAIDPTEIPDLLGHINLIDVVRDGAGTRFRYRLWGTKVTDLYGRDFTGKFVEEIVIPTRVEEVQKAFQEVVDNRLPHFWQVPVPIENRDFLSNRRLVLPLAADGVTVDTLLALMIGDPRVSSPARRNASAPVA